MTVSGFFTVTDVERLAVEQRQRYRELRCGRNQHVTLCDASAMKIQTRDVVAAFTSFTNNPVMRARRLAVIVGLSLARLQTQRVSDSHNVRMFRDREEAETWLFTAAD